MNYTHHRDVPPTLASAWRSVALAACLLAGAPLAAQAVVVTAINGSGQPGGMATAAFTIDFDAGIPTSSFFLTVTPAASLTTLVSSSVTWNDLPVTNLTGIPDAFADPGTGTWGPGYLGALGLSFDPLPLGGKLKLSYTYELTGFTAGQSAGVDLYLQTYDAVADEYPELTKTATLTASAVPEPESWALALAGVAVLGTWAARRQGRSATARIA